MLCVQVWYDDAQSLSVKYMAARAAGALPASAQRVFLETTCSFGGCYPCFILHTLDLHPLTHFIMDSKLYYCHCITDSACIHVLLSVYTTSLSVISNSSVIA